MGKDEKPRKATRKERRAAEALQKRLRREGKLADYKAKMVRTNTGNSAYCTTCDVWYDMNDHYQSMAHDHVS